MTLWQGVPNATIANNGTVTGAAQNELHVVLSDDSGNTWVIYDAEEEYGEVSFSDITLPAGAVIKSAQLRGRLQRGTSSAASLRSIFLVYDKQVQWRSVLYSTAYWTNLGSIFTTGGGGLLTQTHVNAATAWFTRESGSCVIYDMLLDVYYVTIPVATVTAPTGTITDNSTPTVQWTRTHDADGGVPTHYEATIRDAGTNEIVAESGIVASEDTSWTPTTVLPDNDYIATVRVAQTVNGNRHWSATDTEAFTIDLDRPADPTLSLFPEASSGRIRIELEDPGGGAVSTDFFTVEASYDGGSTFTVLRAGTEGLITPTAGAATVYNYDAPNGVLVYYRARSLHWFSGATGITGSYSAYVKDTDTWTSTDWWLKHPTLPSLNFSPQIRSQPTRQSQIAQGVFHPLGRRTPIVVSDTRQAFTGEVVLRCDTDADRAELDAILADGSPLLLQAPPGTYWEDTWFSVSAHERSRPIDSGWSGYTFDSLSWTEVDQPTESRQEET